MRLTYNEQLIAECKIVQRPQSARTLGQRRRKKEVGEQTINSPHDVGLYEHGRGGGAGAVEADWEVLRDEVVVLQQNDDVHLELDLEVLGRDRRASKQPREDHVHRNGHATADVAAANLVVLDLRGCVQRREACKKKKKE